MRPLRLPLALAAALTLAVAATASAQAPAVSIGIPAGQNTTAVVGNAFDYTVTANAEVTFTAKLTFRYKGRAKTISKTLRTETNGGGVTTPVRYSLPAASSAVQAIFSKLRKAPTVTLTVELTGAGGFHKTLVKSAKLKKS